MSKYTKENPDWFVVNIVGTVTISGTFSGEEPEIRNNPDFSEQLEEMIEAGTAKLDWDYKSKRLKIVLLDGTAILPDTPSHIAFSIEPRGDIKIRTDVEVTNQRRLDRHLSA